MGKLIGYIAGGLLIIGILYVVFWLLTGLFIFLAAMF